MPSSVSAIKVGGQRAYKRVRAGEEVVLAARPVTVPAATSRTCAGRGRRPRRRRHGALLQRHLRPGHRPRPGRRARRRRPPHRAASYRRRAVRGSRRRSPWTRSPTTSRCCRSRRWPGVLPALDLDEEQAARRRVRSPRRWTLERTGPVAVFAPDGGSWRCTSSAARSPRRWRSSSERTGRAANECSRGVGRVGASAYPARTGAACGSGVHCRRFRPTSAAPWSRSATSTACTSATSTVARAGRRGWPAARGAGRRGDVRPAPDGGAASRARAADA